MTTIAEGVERPEQARQLAEGHCELAQGHLYARPLRTDAFEGLLRQQEEAARSGTPPAPLPGVNEMIFRPAF